MSFPYVQWSDFRSHMDWKQGEHVTIVAPTEGGKTVLARGLLPVRNAVAVLATKREDESLDAFQADGYKRVKRLEPHRLRNIVYPPFPKDPLNLFTAQADFFRPILQQIYMTGKWTVYSDEVQYMCNDLGLTDLYKIFLLQGRSLRITNVAATQRPRHIPLEFYSQPTHLFLFGDSDMENIRRLSDIAGRVDRRAIMDRLLTIPQHQFVHVNTRTGKVVESKVDY